MYTNWLTNSSLLPPPTSSSSSSSSSTGFVHTPPDVVMKVGPHPGVHFVAHSSVLMMHSGYLRSTLQIDERGMCKNELPFHLTNITADQFAPLLTYMYTGYLDLRIENIFSILLATHVLHIPRALDICREFLSRTTHADSYVNVAILQSNLKNQTRSDDEDDGDLRVNHSKDSNKLVNNDNDASDMNLNAFRIIRPIPSKPTISNLGVIVPPTPHILLPSSDTPFRSLNNFLTNINSPRDTESIVTKNIIEEKQIQTDKINENNGQNAVFPAKRKEKENPKNPSGNQQMRKHFVACVIRKENTISNESKNDKIIIDVASCDGPVKFRRVLNDAYEHHLNKTIDSEKSNPVSDDGSNPFTKQLTMKSNRDCYPFRQQIDKNLNQHQQQQHQQQPPQITESENCNCIKSNENNQQTEAQQGRTNREQTRVGSASDIYSCIYCKHTFKSQYCYEKHAKRHINPLVIEAAKNEISQHPDGPLRDIEKDDGDSVQSIDSSKREVRPLDMNVQYYPCKTCGSKFPSYYFVHKHRKLCHANEDTN